MTHSKILKDTALWQAYQSKVLSDEKRRSWIKEVYESAVTYMLDVRVTFGNYTLHDETHILNVLDAIGGLLGNQIERLTAGEIELLILSACLHDVGMVYTDEEKNRCYQDETACKKFLREYCPELLGCPALEWPEDIRKWYLRTLHPFRLHEVLQNEAWKELFDECPLEVVPKRCIIAVCQAHGQNPAELLHNRDLKYLAANDAEPLFCALLLRLGDLLDFDDTRAPRILYSYVVRNEESCKEWDKHRASAGFRYPKTPSGDDLPYKARCKNPGVEHAVRDFLDWIDEELGNCIRLQKHCETSWQQEFPFPRAVLRDEIESEGYMSGDFCLTMDQTQILKILTGENLYEKTDVFIRELLQNAMDATLLRAKMDPDFIPEKSRIDLWEWNDKDGNVWFRIDDQGTGMTLGMLQRYFLKVGNSYYNSRELERDLRDHGQTKKYQGISQFGIGFLSCFLCGDYAEVSTLYFDDVKNRREEMRTESYQTIHYGLRLQVTGLSGYYTLKNQANHHQAEGNLPAPGWYDAGAPGAVEREGYRANPGTSIAIRLSPGKLGTMNLREVTEGYLCGARVPVYYNNKRIGQTYKEIMAEAHEMAGETIYELPQDMKEQFDDAFPAVRGQYPKIAVTVVPLDTEEDRVLPELSGVLVKYELRFDKALRWQVGGQTYEVDGRINVGKKMAIELRSSNVGEPVPPGYDICRGGDYGWGIRTPFAEKMELHQAAKLYHDSRQEKEIKGFVPEIQYPAFLNVCSKYREFVCAYQGIVAGCLTEYHSLKESSFGVFLLSETGKPMVNVSRSKISGLPLDISLVIDCILNKYQTASRFGTNWFDIDNWSNSSLKEWKKIKGSQLAIWLWKSYDTFFTETMQILQRPWDEFQDDILSFYIYNHDVNAVLYTYLMAYFQEQYQMYINYEKGQILSFCEKGDTDVDEMFDLFPPMMFCMAASEQSRQYICSADPRRRRGITADHPFIAWLLNNAVQLKEYYERQFQQIVVCLREWNTGEIVQVCNSIREQLLSFPEHHGVDVSSCPKLTLDDFWSMDGEDDED